MTIVNSGTKTIGSFLKDSRYFVPEYQRGYSWGENQLEDLWVDLTDLYEGEMVTSHFFGQMVIHSDNTARKRYIVDGQQRTSTAVILLDAFRSVYKMMYEQGKVDAKYEIEDITSMYIGRTSDKRFEPRLFLNDNDRIFFADRIQKEEKAQLTATTLLKLKKAEMLIHKASVYFEKKLREFLERFNDLDTQYKEIKKLLSNFLNNFIFMSIETQDMNEAFIIFETLNARGRELEIADLLKNHVFRTAGDNIADAKVSWDTMIANLDGINPTKFIRHYWNAQHRFVREKDLYMVIRRTINSPVKVTALMNDLVHLSELYTSLNHPHQMTYFKEPTLIEQNKEINNLGAQSYYPIIMAIVIKGFSEAEISTIHSVIECFIVRNFTVAGKTANRSEKNFSGIAQKIAQNELKTVDEVVQAINSLIISDEEFYESFKLFEVKRSDVIRYLLRKIHNHSSMETRIIPDNEAVHIEHILPKKIRHVDDWKIDADKHKEYLNRFGNVTLLGQEYNRSAVNKDFESKKEIYQKSEIPMTLDLINYREWTVEDIERRQEGLAKDALEVWKKS